jgi:hypothetical protein
MAKDETVKLSKQYTIIFLIWYCLFGYILHYLKYVQLIRQNIEINFCYHFTTSRYVVK